jgi:hypothetical protein
MHASIESTMKNHRKRHPTRRLGRWACLLGLGCALATSSLASAQPAAPPDTEAMKEARRQLFKEALLAMGAKKWEECRVKTLGTWTAGKHPQVAALLGVCEVELGLFRDGAEHLRYALDRGEGDQPVRGQQVKDAFAKALTHVGAVDVTAAGAPAEVRLAGRVLGDTPITVYLTPGDSQIELRREGFASKLVSITIAAGEQKPLEVTLDALAPDLKGGDPTQPPVSEVPEPPARDDEPRADKPLWPAFVLGGVGALGVGLGITGFVVSGGAYADAEEAAAAAGPGGCGPDGSACAGVQDSLDSSNTMRGLGIGGVALGGAALAGMVVYLLVPSSSSETGGLRLSPVVGNTNGLVLGGSF